jgi:hypothetical protein
MIAARSRRLVAAIVGVAVAGALLTACSPFDVAHRILGSSTKSGAALPVVGQCWQQSLDQLESWADWQGGNAVSCEGPHQADTYAVVTLTADYPDDWAESATEPGLSQVIGADASAACDGAREKSISLLEPVDYRVMSAFYVPSRAAWKAGARWVRCDVAIVAVDTPYANQELADAPVQVSMIDDALTADTNTYMLCLDSPGTSIATGPFSTGARMVDCTGDAQWRQVGRSYSKEPAGAAYPGDASMRSETNKLCKNTAFDDEDLWTLHPVEKTWAAGGRLFECWVTPQGDVTGPTA